jgi:uncharacterized protein
MSSPSPLAATAADPIDLSAIPALDDHVHPFGRESATLTAAALRDSISVSLRGTTPKANESQLLARVAARELGALLGCEPTFDAVVEARNAVAARGYEDYVGTLFRHQNISGLLVDPGFPAEPVHRGEDFAALMPVPVWEGYRIERSFPYGGSFHGAAGDAPAQPFDAMLEAFEARLDEEAARPGFAFFKTIMAYRTGLAVRPTPRAEAAAAWDAHRAYGDPHEKTIRDFLLGVTCGKARQYDVPVQIHTGHTSTGNVWPDTNPILMAPFLEQDDVLQTKLVLIHCGYPYSTEAGYLTSVFPLVWTDLSLMIPWASFGIALRIGQVLESAPTDKVLFGTDAITLPEMNWLATMVGRRGLSRALAAVAEAGYLTRPEVDEVAADILHRNAERLYDLPNRAAVPPATRPVAAAQTATP